MDISFADFLLKRLFREYCTCKPTPRRQSFSFRTHPSRISKRQAGSYTQFKKDAATKGSGAPVWEPRRNVPPPKKLQEFKDYSLITAEELRQKGRRPKRVKMLMRDFLEDSLYNPKYGYFTTQARILTTGPPMPFSALRSEAQFNSLLSERYTVFEDRLDAESPNDLRQLWHTPTELFNPHYAEAMARYFVANYKISLYPYRDLVIYELGAGNATFALNVLDYIRAADPEVYARTRYAIVEISPHLASVQRATLSADPEHMERIHIIERSIFDWKDYVPDPCFFVALEVVDNFGHDVVRYDSATQEPQQALVYIDTDGELYELWTAALDPCVRQYLAVRAAARSNSSRSPPRQNSSYQVPSLRRRAQAWLAGESRLYTTKEYVPTRLMDFFSVLAAHFPAHRLLLSDFHYLPEACPGINAPVVQTRYKRRTVPVSTPLVGQGFFDIFFPTDFGVMEDVYRAVTGRLTNVVRHEEFMRRWAFLEETRCRNGENPLVSWYRNASVLATV